MYINGYLVWPIVIKAFKLAIKDLIQISQVVII